MRSARQAQWLTRGTTVDQGREAQGLMSSIMQALDQLSREALIALVHDLQARLDALVDAGHAPAGDLDYVALQALTVLDNSGIAALVFDTAGTLPILAANA